MRRLLLAAAAALPVLLLWATPAQAGPPRMYHTITAALGNANVDRTVGCRRTEVFVSSSVAMYAAQPGPVTKQGATDVLVRVSDVCTAAPRAGGGGGTVLAEYEGRSAVPLTADPRLRWARVSAALHDSTRPALPITVSVAWTGRGPLDHTTTHIHDRYPGEGVVSSTANDLHRDADAVVSVAVADVSLSSVPTAEALLEQTRSHCIEVPRPGVDGFYPCFGFPG